MSLLEEGIATGNVLPTGRKEKHSIDNVTRDFDIYRIKCDLLFYNDQNDRIATWVSEYNSAQGADLLALGRDEYNGVIEDFIVESNPGALRKTEKSIALRGQLRPGIVLNDGRVIDGNRRLTCVRRLARANNEAGWFEAAILDDATGSDPKRIKLLELAIQIGEEEKVAYDPVDRLVGVYRDVVKNHLITPAEYGNATGMTEAEVKKLVDRAQYMEEFLEFCQAPEQYHLARALKVDGPLGEFSRVLKKYDNRRDKQLVKRLMFANMVVQPEGDITRYVRDFGSVAGKGCGGRLQGRRAAGHVRAPREDGSRRPHAREGERAALGRQPRRRLQARRRPRKRDRAPRQAHGHARQEIRRLPLRAREDPSRDARRAGTRRAREGAPQPRCRRRQGGRADR